MAHQVRLLQLQKQFIAKTVCATFTEVTQVEALNFSGVLG